MDSKALRPLRVNAAELLRQPGSVKPIDVTVAGVDLEVVHEALAGDVQVTVDLETMNDGVVVRGEVRAPGSARADAACATSPAWPLRRSTSSTRSR